jgi:hypothetical protein
LYVFEEQRRGRLQRRAPAQQVAQAGLQPLDLTQIYDIIEDEEKAKLAAAMIAQSLENVGVRALNWREPPRPEVETGTGPGAETGVGGEEETGVGGEEETGVGGEEEKPKRPKKVIKPIEGCDNVLAQVIGIAVVEVVEKALRNRLEGLVKTLIGVIPWVSAGTGAQQTATGIDLEDAITDLVFKQLNKLIVDLVGQFEYAEKGNEAAQVILGDDKFEVVCAMVNKGSSVETIQSEVTDMGPLELVGGVLRATEAGYLTESAALQVDSFRELNLATILPDEAEEFLKDKLKSGDDEGTFTKLAKWGGQFAVSNILEYPVGNKIVDWLTKEEEEEEEEAKTTAKEKGKEEKGKEEEEPEFKVPASLAGPGHRASQISDKEQAALQESQLKRWKELAGIIHS